MVAIIASVVLNSLLVNPFIDTSNSGLNSMLNYVVTENRRELNNIENRHITEKEANSWSIGKDGKWVAYDKDSNLVKGLFYDNARNSYFLTGFDSGNLIYENGLYDINDKIVHLTFSSNRTGTYGKIESGVDKLKDILN